MTYYVCRLKDTWHYFTATRDGDNFVYTDTQEVIAPEWIAAANEFETMEQAERVASVMDRKAAYLLSKRSR